MGSSQSAEEAFVAPVFLSELLRADPVNWPRVAQVLRDEPEQACAYAHFVEPSQLQVALTKAAPVYVVQLFLDAYQDALYHAVSKETPLHLAVELNDEESSKRVQLLLKRRYGSSLASQVDANGLLPLQRSLRNPEIAKLLLLAYPQGLQQRSGQGRIALHHALLQSAAENQVNVQVLQMMVEHAPLPHRAILTRAKNGATPLQLLSRHLERVFDNPNIQDDYRNTLWNLLVDWIRRISKDDTPLLELHSLVEYGCLSTKSMTTHALHEFSQQTHLRNSMGQTPLHIAASSRFPTTDALIECLIASNPASPRMTDKEGRLPIDLAAEVGKTECQGLSWLLKGEPRAIDTRDLRDGYYPFLSAALGEHSGVSTTYYLLRAKPHVLSYFHSP
jgi:ankyrin repeat protein